jgi:putative endonuclease
MESGKNLGRASEEEAVRYLRGKGLTILRTNYRTPQGEIDIVAREGDTIVFVEVKARSTTLFGPPEAAVNREKQRQIKSISKAFISHYQLFDHDCRFDIVAVLKKGTSVTLKHIPNAFY